MELFRCPKPGRAVLPLEEAVRGTKDATLVLKGSPPPDDASVNANLAFCEGMLVPVDLPARFPALC